MPAMYLDFACLACSFSARSAGPRVREPEPKTMRARSCGVSLGAAVVVDDAVDVEAAEVLAFEASVLRGRPGLRLGFFSGVVSVGTGFFPGGKTSGAAEFGGSSGFTAGMSGGDLSKLS